MKQFIKTITSFLLAIISVSAFANGDPVVSYSSINRVANPEPLSIAEIRIVKETLNIRHIGGYNCFDVTYEFENTSEKDFPEIHYGFPIDYLIKDEREAFRMSPDWYSESLQEVGWHSRLIKDVRFVFNGKELAFQSAKESVREAGVEIDCYIDEDGRRDESLCDTIPYDGINRRWYYTMFSMAPHSKATLNVRYKVYASHNAGLDTDSYDFSFYSRGDDIIAHSLLRRYFPEDIRILYDFTPAKHFGDGQKYPLSVDIDLSDLGEVTMLTEDDRSSGNIHITRDEFGEAANFKPIDLRILTKPIRDKEGVEQIISPLLVPAERYNVTTSAQGAVIDFTAPTFVSDLACDIDTEQEKSITAVVSFSDETKKIHQYAPKVSKYDGKKISDPVLLTIVDLIEDGNAETDFNSEEFKIKQIRIEFKFNPSSSSLHQFSTFRPIDARFKE